MSPENSRAHSEAGPRAGAPEAMAPVTATVEATPASRARAHAAAAEAAQLFAALAADEDALEAIAAGGELLARCLERGDKVLACGNGGSMSDAIHLAEELTGRFRADRRALAAIALSDPGHLTCVGNDLGYDAVFSRGVEALGRPGDVLVAFTTSGTSANVLHAARTARSAGLEVVAITGRHGTPVAATATVTVVTPGGAWADRVQEMHTLVLHTLIEIVEAALGLNAGS